MKILFLTSNPQVSNPLYDWLIVREDDVCYGNEPISAEFIRENNIDFIVSYNYIHIIRKTVLDLLPHRVINLHTSFLPYNRGVSPNIWSFIDETPSGVTIHEVDEGLDTGDILLQRQIVFDRNTETLKSSYDKLQQMIQETFRENWDSLKLLKITPQKQPHGGTMHMKKDMLYLKTVLNYGDRVSEFLEKVEHLNQTKALELALK